ncbi:MAG: phage tail protein [Bacteroidetes bacterium]|nr:phage tail protein [Bacteroidota bacterium]
MSFKAKFNAGGIEANILSCAYQLYQEVDATGRPSSISRGGRISITIEGTASTELFEWMCNSLEHKDGSLIFIKRDSDATLKELKFKDGYIINFFENFQSTSDEPLSVGFMISAREITMGSSTHINEWV